MIKIKNSKFITSAVSYDDAPKLNLPEFIMIGRSNVGKSSFINALCNRKSLAYVGKTPGKTRLINLYDINGEFILTDLPGYGFAQRSKHELEKWRKKIEEYLVKRKEIICAIHLIDSRHDLQKNDMLMREWLDYYELNTLTVLTKSDCISKSKIKPTKDNFDKIFSTDSIVFSSKNKLGKNDVLKYMSKLLNEKSSR